jgi:glycosyltransferase involved in cell wall biosynthesis
LQTIYTNNDNYNSRRSFLEHHIVGYHFKREIDFFKIPDALAFKLFGKIYTQLHHSHRPFPWSKAQLFHFFNTVSYGSIPWITTFETTLPRWGENSNSISGNRLLAKPACKKLIALSDCAAQMQQSHLMELDANLAEEIVPKILVKLPPQKPLIQTIEGKQLGKELTFTIVGAEFFRKGGAEVLEVFSELWKKGATMRLNIVSSLQYGDYATKTSIQDLQNAQKLIAKYAAFIKLHQRLPNAQVLELLKASHVGLLPTYADSFGYSVLEAQAAGCPVITTDIRALPEINNEQKGWMIQVPKLPSGNGKLNNPDERALFSHTLKLGLNAKMEAILNNPSGIAEKARASYNSILTDHSPSEHATFLANVYNEVLGTE